MISRIGTKEMGSVPSVPDLLRFAPRTRARLRSETKRWPQTGANKMRRFFLALTFLQVGLFSGCGKPDKVTTIRSPTEGLFYTVETSFGHGAISSDYTNVYAHLERNGKSDRKLVIGGEYLESIKITWTSSHDVMLCLHPGSFTDSFSNEVTLIVGDASETIHNHLQEHCDGMSKASTGATDLSSNH